MKRIVHKRNLKKIVRPALFTVGFAAVGFFYDLFLRCADGSCAVTPEPISFMLYMGAVGLILALFTGKECEGCNT